MTRFQQDAFTNLVFACQDVKAFLQDPATKIDRARPGYDALFNRFNLVLTSAEAALRDGPAHQDET